MSNSKIIRIFAVLQFVLFFMLVAWLVAFQFYCKDKLKNKIGQYELKLNEHMKGVKGTREQIEYIADNVKTLRNNISDIKNFLESKPSSLGKNILVIKNESKYFKHLPITDDLFLDLFRKPLNMGLSKTNYDLTATIDKITKNAEAFESYSGHVTSGIVEYEKVLRLLDEELNSSEKYMRLVTLLTGIGAVVFLINGVVLILISSRFGTVKT